jgi:hypothetical protein
MPRKRRKGGGLNGMGTTLREAQALRRAIDDRLQRYNDPKFTKMEEGTRRRLSARLTDAVEMARLGMPDIVGRRAKKRAWTLEALIFDISNALHRAGVPVAANPDPLVNPAQALSRELAVMAGLARDIDEVGTLYKQALLARRILLAGYDWSDVWLDGRMALSPGREEQLTENVINTGPAMWSK